MNRRLRIACVLLVAATACRQETKAPSTTSAAGQTETAVTATTETGIPEEVPAGAPLRVGSAVPEIEVLTLDGKPAHVGGASGKVVLLNIWATWCGPCRAEIPELIELHHARGPQGFEVVGVSVDDTGMEPDIRDFIAQFKINYPVLHDPDGKTAAMFQSTVIPTSALIDRKGKIVWVGIGPVNPKDPDFRKALDAATTAG